MPLASVGKRELCFLVLFAFLASAAAQSLRPGGRNVREVRSTTYVKECTSVRKQCRRTIRSTTCRWFDFWSHCVGGTKSVYRYVYRTCYENKCTYVPKTVFTYVCYTGWKANGDECTTPICTGGCQNNGTCTAPNNCTCKAGWTGSRCRSDIDECRSNQNNCTYKPGCRNTAGSYRCTCRIGYYLAQDQRTCKDINECSSGNNTCNINTHCINTPGSYSCPCNSGFSPVLNLTNNCTDIDECNPSSGIVHGCQGTCVNFIGGYNCTCPKGHYLASNKKDCTDHDECAGNIHGCEQECVNYPGGYNCTCHSGYRLAIDYTSCEDVNECSEHTSGCFHNCTNLIGSYSCSCNVGYYLGSDQKSCEDINECASGNHYCEHTCLNVDGSYTCKCREGFDLDLNGLNCTGRPCVPIFNPRNGKKSCSGYTTEHICHFKCSPGYELTGSENRTCTATKVWTGVETTCKIIHCPIPIAPQYGFIYQPCNTEFASHCSLGCSRGYYMDSSNEITCNANANWEPNNTECKEILACKPNPCLHGGKCSTVSSDEYSCDCTGTGYGGTKCNIGNVIVPGYTTLTVGVSLASFLIRSSRPDDHIVLTPRCRGLIFKPSVLVFINTTVRQSIEITAQQPGLYSVQYTLSGPSARDFQAPQASVILARSANSTEYTRRNVSQLSTFPTGCYYQTLVKCPNEKDLTASSTSSWKRFGPVVSTNGVVSVKSDTANFPLVLSGTSFSSSNRSRVPLKKQCKNSNVYSTEELIQSRVFTKLFLDNTVANLPKWLKIKLRDTWTNPPDLKSLISSGENLRRMDVGTGQPVPDHTYFSILSSRHINLTIQNDSDLLRSHDHDAMSSIAVDLCGASSKNVILRPSKPDLDVVNNIAVVKKLKEYGWNFTFRSVQISKNKSISKLKKATYWSGKEFFKVDAPKGNMALVTSMHKYFKSLNFVNSRIWFDGTIIVDVEDLENILDSPLKQEWKVDMYGNIKLVMEFKVLGKMTNITLNAPKSISYAALGGNPEEKCFGGTIHKPQGLFITKNVQESPFVHSELDNFVKLGANKTISAFLETIFYLNKNINSQNLSTYVEVNHGVSMTFRGHLKFDPLRFDEVDIQLQMTNQECPNNPSILSRKTGVQFNGNTHSIPERRFGIFKTTSDVPLNLRFNVASDRNGSSEGSFQSVVKLFGFEKQVNVSIFPNRLTFNTSGNVYGLYTARMICTSSLVSWEKQIFIADGDFQKDSDDLIYSLTNALNTYAVASLNKVIKRQQSSRQTEERARLRLEKAQSLMNQKREQMMRTRNTHDIAKHNLAVTKKFLNYLEKKASNYSKLLNQSRSEIDNLCQVSECPSICHEGEVCITCYHDIISKSMGVCPATCHKIKQERIPPHVEIALCEEEQCKRIHSTNGLFKQIFGEKLGELVKGVVSFAVNTVVSAVFSPAAGAVAGGLVDLIDTGRPQDFLCGVSRGFVGVISKPTSWTITAYEVASKNDERVNEVEELDCYTEQKKGSWNCRTFLVKCTKGRFEYKYHHIPYTCEYPCEKFTVTETIEKTCCSTAPCASFVVNITCIAENALCKKARKEALKRLAQGKTNSISLLQRLENAKENVSYWKIKKRKALTSLLSATNSHNISQSVVTSLQKAHNSTVQARTKVLQILAKPLKLQALLDESQQKVVLVKLEEIRFTARIIPNDESKLLPIQITFRMNGTREEMSTVLDFRNLNTSLRSIAKEILGKYLSSFSRKKRSIESGYSPFNYTTVDENQEDQTISTLKKYHKLCSKFVNHERALYHVILSLYNLSSEAKQLLYNVKEKNVSKPLNTTLLFERFKLNETMASNFGLNTSSNQYSSILETDPELLEVKELQKQAIQASFEPLQITSELLFKRWYAAMENVFNVLATDCAGFDDCLKYTIDSMSEIYESIGLPGTGKILEQIKAVKTKISSITEMVDMSIEQAVEISMDILKMLKDMRNVNILCASAPNITEQPNAFTKMNVGETLVLTCNATGDSLVYTWRFNGRLLDYQNTSVLLIKNITRLHTGNYTCEVSNHISKETSIPALVIIHGPPVINLQPPERLNVILSDEDSLQCQAESSDKNITYQWWFKSAKSTSFVSLPNETFSYLNFFPVKANHEGWYFCNVSNSYGFDISKTSFVTVLHFSLPIPVAKISLSVTGESPENETSETASDEEDYSLNDIRSKITTSLFLSTDKVFDVSGLSPTGCRKVGTAETCKWAFLLIGTNITSNSTIHDEFQTNANKVINATLEVKTIIGELINVTNTGALSFLSDNIVYSVEKQSFIVEDLSLLCPKRQILIKEDFKCVNCPPGFYGDFQNGIATCKICPVGSYQDNSGQISCIACPKPFTTTSQGSYKKEQCKVLICPAGHYGKITQTISQCLECPKGTYQPMEGKFSCIFCPSGYVTAAKGTVDISKCNIGRELKPTKSPTFVSTTINATGEIRDYSRNETNNAPMPTKTYTFVSTTINATGEIRDYSRNEINNAPMIGGVVGGLFAITGLVIIIIIIWKKRRTGKRHLRHAQKEASSSTDRYHSDKKIDFENPTYEGMSSSFHHKILENEDGENHPSSFENALYNKGTEELKDEAHEEIKLHDLKDDQKNVNKDA